MRRKLLLPRIFLVVLIIVLKSGLQVQAQQKIGDNPTQIHPFSILELESGNQGFRLAQGDTTAVNTSITLDPDFSGGNVNDINNPAVQAAEGLIIYQATTQDTGIYVRTKGVWKKLLSGEAGGNFWEIGGNTIDTDSAFLGIGNNKTLSIGSNNKGYIFIQPDGTFHVISQNTLFNGAVTIDSTLYARALLADTATIDTLSSGGGAFQVNSDTIYFSKPLFIQDSLVIKSLENALAEDSSVMILGADGTVRKLPMDSLSAGAQVIINGENNSTFELVFGNDDSRGGPWIDTLSAADNNGLTRFSLNIPIAGEHVTGLVDTLAQIFSGNKSFTDSIAIGTPDKPNAALDINGSINMAVTTVSGNTDLGAGTAGNYRTILVDASTGDVEIILPVPVDGRIYTIRKIAGEVGNKVTVTGPFYDGNGSMPIYTPFSVRTIQAFNGEWHLIQ